MILDKTAAIPYDYPSYKLTFSSARVFMIDVVVMWVVKVTFLLPKNEQKNEISTESFSIVCTGTVTYGRPSTIFLFERSTTKLTKADNSSPILLCKQPSPCLPIIHNPFVMSALVPRVGTGMSVQSAVCPPGSSRGGRPSGSALACNRCSKPLATTCFLCSCDCIFCEGKFYTSFVIHFCW